MIVAVLASSVASILNPTALISKNLQSTYQGFFNCFVHTSSESNYQVISNFWPIKKYFLSINLQRTLKKTPVGISGVQIPYFML